MGLRSGLPVRAATTMFRGLAVPALHSVRGWLCSRRCTTQFLCTILGPAPRFPARCPAQPPQLRALPRPVGARLGQLKRRGAMAGASLPCRFRGRLSEPRGLNTRCAYAGGGRAAALSGPWLRGPEPWITTTLCRRCAGAVLRCAGGVAAEGPRSLDSCRFM